MKLLALMGMGLVLMLPSFAHAKVIGDIDVVEQMTVAEQPLILNGAGVRSKFFY